MLPAFIWAIALAIFAPIMWIASFIAFARADGRPWFVLFGLIGNLSIVAAVVAAIVGVVQLILAALA